MCELLVGAFLNIKILDGVLCNDYFVLKFSSIRSASKKDVFSICIDGLSLNKRPAN